jgi:hypothetical protein
VFGCGLSHFLDPSIGAKAPKGLPVDELIAKANIAYLRQVLKDAELTRPERDRELQRLAREEAKLFARSVRDARALRA